MAELNNEKMTAGLLENIKKCEDKTFNVYFYVIDTKGYASGTMAYVYKTAYALQELGYKVTMLYQLTDEDVKNNDSFVGVSGWLGEKYASLPHANIAKENVEVNAADFIFIPEVLANVMDQVKSMPCKKVAILTNYNNVSRFMPFSSTWGRLGVRDAVAISDEQAELLKGIFPNVVTKVVRPSLSKAFRDTEAPRDMMINIACKDSYEAKRIIADFYWKYPMFKWVSFTDLTTYRNRPEADLAEALKKAPFTVWCDADSSFGYLPLEAMRCGSVVIGKIPENMPAWMLDKNGKIANNGVWFYNTNDVDQIILGAVNAWTNDEFPDMYAKEMKKTAANYTQEKQAEDIKKIYVDGYFADRKKELEIALSIANNNATKTENTNE